MIPDWLRMVVGFIAFAALNKFVNVLCAANIGSSANFLSSVLVFNKWIGIWKCLGVQQVDWNFSINERPLVYYFFSVWMCMIVANCVRFFYACEMMQG